MDVALVFKIAAVGIIVSVLHTVIRQAGKEEFAWLVTLSGIVVVLMMVIRLISDFFESVKAVFQLY
ncbi:MAG: stage III sporulation protein AC [Bacillota bacterium]